MTFTWPIDRSCLPALPVLSGSPTTDEQAAYDLKLEQRNAAEDLATQVLWALTGRRFGAYQTVARPCVPLPWRRYGFDRATGMSYLGYEPFFPVYWDGAWRNLSCGCVERCSVSGPRTAHLPGPVASIVTVTIDGTDLDPSEYTLEGNVLYRVGKDWPQQALSRPLGEAGTWSVTYLRGLPVPPGADKLVGLLAKEFLAACDSTVKCRLPRNVTGVNRNGVSYQVYNPSTIYAQGWTGLAEVDMWIAAMNPHHLMAAPSVL